VGYLVKRRTHLTSAAAKAIHTGGNGVEMVACAVWGGGGGLFDMILERGDSDSELLKLKMLSPGFWVGSRLHSGRFMFRF
jgi:hypothetical protein